MARQPRPVRGAGRGGEAHFTYARFMADLLSGAAKATALHDTRAPDGEREVRIAQIDENGRPLPPVILRVPVQRLVAMAYDEPNGNGGPRPDNQPPDRTPRDRGTP